VWYRELAWQAVAKLRLMHGDRAGARRAANRGMQLVEEYRDSLGATDLRALASRRLTALVDLGLRTALDDGRPALVLRWADRSRAAHLRRAPVSPPQDERLAEELGRLRQIVAERLRSVELGEAYRPDLVRRQTSIERSVRDRRRHLRGTRGPGAGAVAVPALMDLLADAVLVEYIASDGRLYAVTCARGRLRLHELCAVAEVDKAVTFVLFTLRRLVISRTPDRAAAAMRALERDGRLLDRLLLQPLRQATGDGPLVIVPTSVLQGIPWSILPTCAGRPVSVAPSAALWHDARTAASAPRSGTVLVCGPDLPHALTEVTALADLHPGAHVLTGPQARSDQVLSALDGADLAHIAAHGTFRADNPQFSALHLADGPLTVYDLERLRRAPRRLVLAACDSARTSVLTGDELLGLAPTVLSLGAEAMVASVVLVPDAETRPLMTDLHTQLRAGQTLAAALAAAQTRARASGEPRSVAAATAYICIGAG
jgi:hypothetical protein